LSKASTDSAPSGENEKLIESLEEWKLRQRGKETPVILPEMLPPETTDSKGFKKYR
jgi:hypothetical protein